MKLLLASMTLLLSMTTFADTLEKHIFNGIERPYTLRELGMGGASMAAYTKVRIQGERGTTYGDPTFIFKNAFQSDPKIKSSKFDIIIGFKTKGLPLAVNIVKTYRIPAVEAITFEFSGMKKELFQKVFKLMTEHKELLTGEVRVEAIRSSFYTIKAKVHLIKKWIH